MSYIIANLMSTKQTTEQRYDIFCKRLDMGVSEFMISAITEELKDIQSEQDLNDLPIDEQHYALELVDHLLELQTAFIKTLSTIVKDSIK
jgi:hypothetical protein